MSSCALCGSVDTDCEQLKDGVVAVVDGEGGDWDKGENK